MKRVVAVGLICLLCVVCFGQVQPDPLALTEQEITELAKARKAAEDAELQFERAEAQRDAALSEWRRLIAFTVGEHGKKPSEYGIGGEGKRIERLPANSSPKASQQPVNGPEKTP
jgi:hypothetical protein